MESFCLFYYCSVHQEYVIFITSFIVVVVIVLFQVMFFLFYFLSFFVGWGGGVLFLNHSVSLDVAG